VSHEHRNTHIVAINRARRQVRQMGEGERSNLAYAGALEAELIVMEDALQRAYSVLDRGHDHTVETLADRQRIFGEG